MGSHLPTKSEIATPYCIITVLNFELHKTHIVKFDSYRNKGGGCRILVLYQQSFYWQLNLGSAFYPLVQVDQQLHYLAESHLVV